MTMNSKDQVEQALDPEALALLQIAALGEEQIRAGKVYPLADAVRMIRERSTAQIRATQQNQGGRKK